MTGAESYPENRPGVGTQWWVVLKPEVVCDDSLGDQVIEVALWLISHNLQMSHAVARCPGLALNLKELLLWP